MKWNKWPSLLLGLLLFFTGWQVLRNPGASLYTFGIYFITLMFVSAIVDIFGYFAQPKEFRRGWDLASASATAILALMLMLSDTSILWRIPTAVAIWLLIKGGSRLAIAFSLTQNSGGLFGHHLAWFGVITILLGMFLLFNPFLTVLMVAYLIGFTLIYEGVMAIINFFRA
ncbi:HdeD family acid-resistance protein [Streptococcus merionis]|uniref:HdeD family acid-resistance protein n=1 Tax=Streptococcus merionis TaxID=400065 RepID=UPI0035154EE0